MARLLMVLCLLSSAVAAAIEPAATVVPPEIVRQFRAIEELSARSRYVEAARMAEELRPALRENPAGQALVLRNLATLYGFQKHYLHAAGLLEEALALHGLAAADEDKARLELGQYYAAGGNLERAAEVLGAWLQSAGAPRPEHLLLLADIRMRLKQFAEAAALLDQAINRSEAPKPEWYQLLAGLHHEARDLPKCARVLQSAVARFPENLQYWNQLTGVYQEAGDPQRALAVQQLMHRQGLLASSAQIVQLAQALRSRGLHCRAAELLQAELERGRVADSAAHRELLAATWLDAKELRRAAQALEKALALNDSAETQHRLGQIYSELRDWSKAQQTLSRAIGKGGLKNPGGAYLLLGLAHYRLNARDKARAAFVKARESQTVRRTAQQWLEHMDKEGRRHG